jgi:ribosome-interacting GTPase 1
VYEDIRQMATLEIQEEIGKLENEYKQATENKADIHTVNKIWRRIQDLKAELKQRKP